MAGGHSIDPSLQGAVSERVFMLVLWIFWFLSLIALAVRIAVYIRAHRRPQVDDYLLMVSVACLTVATLWMQTRYGDAYEIIALSIDPIKAGIPTDIPGTIYRSQLVGYVYAPLIWTAIFTAKLSYLFFFRPLVQHIRPLRQYWWFILTFTLLVYPVCLAGRYISCPYMDLNALKCSQQPLIGRALNVAIVSMALDMTTDAMIVTIPIWLLWKVKIRLSQKLGLACFLCLSIVIAVMAIIRVSPLRLGEHPNLAIYSMWIDMMGQVEACVAVILVSLTAFRYFFVMRERRRHEEAEQERHRSPWYRSHLDRLRRRQQQQDGDEEDGRGSNRLPQIPSATLSGLRTFIRNVRRNNNNTMGSTMRSNMVTLATNHSDEVPLYINNNEKIDEKKQMSNSISSATATTTTNHTTTSSSSDDDDAIIQQNVDTVTYRI